MSTVRSLALLSFLVIASWTSGQQIQFLDCESALTDNNGTPFYAVKNTECDATPFGRVRFTPDGTPDWEYTWEYNGIVQTPIYEGDSSYMTVSIPGDGDIRFRAEKTGTSPVETQFTVFFVCMPISIAIENEMDCHYITLKVDGVDTPPSYNGYAGAENPVYTVVWGGKERTLASVPEYYKEIAQLVEEEYSDVRCKLRIKDRFGLTWESDEVTYHSYIPSAEFSADPMQGEAPLEVTFNYTGENAQQFEWYLYKDTTEVQPGAISVEDSLIEGRVFNEQNLPPYVYEHPGSYNVKLVVVNTRGINQCSDTMYIDQFIVVDSSLVDVPNVFTPNGDGINDIFQAKAQSLEYFHGVILNRWGRKVYEWDDPQGGWNGKIHGKYASPGTYFYVITAKGREIETKKYTKKGALLLVR